VSLSSLLKHVNVKPVSQQLQYPKIAFISSSPKHLGYKPASPQQHDKTTALISALMGFGVSLLGFIGKMLKKTTR